MVIVACPARAITVGTKLRHCEQVAGDEWEPCGQPEPVWLGSVAMRYGSTSVMVQVFPVGAPEPSPTTCANPIHLDEDEIAFLGK